MVSRREQAKEANRRRIVEAARSLALETGSTEFTLKDLAARASVSTFTTHNLIGTKARVLFQVLVEHIEEIQTAFAPVAPSLEEAIEYCLSFGDAPVNLYGENEPFYRAIIRFYLSSNDAALRSIYLAYARKYWIDAVDHMASLDLLAADVDRVDLVRAMHVGFTGTMEFWAHGELSTVGLRAQTRTVLALVLLGTMRKKYQARLHEILALCRPDINDASFGGLA